MKNTYKISVLVLVSLSMIISSCKKDADIIANNDAPYYGEISTLLLAIWIFLLLRSIPKFFNNG